MKQLFKFLTFFTTVLFLGILLFPGFSNAAVLDIPVAASADDAYETGAGDVNSISTSIYVRAFSYNPNSPMHGGFRWQVNVPQGATIVTSYITFNMTYADYNMRSNVYFHKTANANNFVDNQDVWSLANRPTTTASVYWQQANCGGRNGASCVSPELKTLVQEIVNQPAWAANNYMVALFLADSTVDGDYSWKAVAADYGSRQAILHIEYTVLDTAPPIRSAGQPSGTLVSGTTQTIMSLVTDENATCKYSNVAGISYDLMPNTFSTTGGMSHSTIITDLNNGTGYTYYIRCQDTAVPPHQNTDDNFFITFSVAEPTPPDATPPVISNVQISSITTSTAVITWTTDDLSSSIVNYGLTVSFGSSQSGSSSVTNHSVNLAGLSSNTAYYYQVRSCNSDNYCNDSLTYNFTTEAPPAAGSTIIGTLSLVPAFENIAVYSNFTGDENANNQAILEYRPLGGSWKQGIAMTADRRDNLVTGTGTVVNSYKNQWRAVIFGLNPDTGYDVKITYTDSDGGSGTVQGSITTRNDNPSSIGNTYYVATTGNDTNGNGSQDNPWLTIAKAASMVSAGDTVRIKAGTYNEQVVISKSGTANNYITFMSDDPNNKAVITRAPTSNGTIRIVDKSYNRFKNLNIYNTGTGSQGATIYIGGASVGNIIEGCLLSLVSVDWWAGGVYINSGPENTLVQNNQITTPSSGQNGAFGVMLVSTGGGTVIRNNTITGGFYDGIGGGSNTAINGGPYKNSYIYGNTVDGANDDGIEAEGGGMNCAVWNNITKNNSYASIAVAPVIIGPTYVFRNVGFSSGQMAVKMGSSSYGFLYVYHNTFYQLVVGYYGFALYGNNAIIANAVFKNNIVETRDYLVEEGSSGLGLMDFDYNSMYSTKSNAIKWKGVIMTYNNWRANYSQESDGVWGQNSFVNAAGGDFHLQSSSAAVDEGLIIQGFNDQNSSWAYKGTAPDMGAYEYDSGVPPPSVFTLSSTDRLHLFRGQANIFQIQGNNFDLNTSFIIQFLQNSSVISFFTSQPVNSTTFSLSLTSTQINTLPIGFYDLKIVRSTDSAAQTYTKQILITVLGDIWSSTATEVAEQKRDGKVNIYDTSRILSKWGSIVAADLAECDINAGPDNLSQSKIDLYDANLIMRNWLP